MRCPYCKEINADKVIDSRLSEAGEVIRRRRVCQSCGKRFTTKERVEHEVKLMVVKSNGGRVPYERNKILGGIQRACYKRPVDEAAMQRIVDEVEDTIFKQHDREISSRKIGSVVCDKLRDVDQIAYLRFASVYRSYEDLHQLIEEAQEVMRRQQSRTPNQQKLFE
jgi:transcriptional repressor NrdR